MTNINCYKTSQVNYNVACLGTATAIIDNMSTYKIYYRDSNGCMTNGFVTASHLGQANIDAVINFGFSIVKIVKL